MKKNLTLLIAVLSLCYAAKTVNAQVSKPGNAGLSSIDPGRYDNSWWNRAPYRLVQTNLREIDATMDVDAYVQSMVDANANIVLINVGGIVANYPTKLPYHFKKYFHERRPGR